MQIESNTAAIILGLATIFLAAIILLHYKRGSQFIGFKWWAFGYLLLGIRFLIPVITLGSTLEGFSSLFSDWLLIAGSMMFYFGLLRLFYEPIWNHNQLILISVYFIVTIPLYLTGNDGYASGLTLLLVAYLSVMTARKLNLNKTSISFKPFRFLSLTFLFHALFFFIFGIFTLLPTHLLGTRPLQLLTFISSFVILGFGMVWAAVLIYLVNDQFIKSVEKDNRFYDLTINTIPDAVIISRLKDGLIIKVNDGFTKLSGYSADEAVGKTTLEINIWQYPQERQKFVILVTETGFAENLNLNFLCKNGKVLNGLVSARTVVIEGKPHILSVVRDNTSRKKMEDKLRENEENYRFLAENSADVIWHINRSYKIDYISPADEKVRGYRREEVLGQPIWGIFKPEGIKLIRGKIENYLQKEQIGNNTNTTRFEVEQKCKNGSWVWTEITAAPHYDNQGKLIGYHGISRDISERKAWLEQLNRLATIDELTQVPNRRYFMNLAETELNRAKRYHHPLSIIMIDFNNLKKINDTYGHLAGDRALSVFAKIVKALIREVDVIGRFGGDEFLILLPETELSQAYQVVNRIHQVLATSPVYFQNEQFSISVTAGIAALEDWSDTFIEILDRADKDLYESKKPGQPRSTRQ